MGPTGPKGGTQLTSAVVFPTIQDVLTTLPVNFSASGDNVLVAGVIGKVIKVWRMFVVADDVTTLIFKDGSSPLSGPLSGKLRIVLDLNDKPWYQTSPGNDFVVHQSSGIQVGGTLWITQS